VRAGLRPVWSPSLLSTLSICPSYVNLPANSDSLRIFLLGDGLENAERVQHRVQPDAASILPWIHWQNRRTPKFIVQNRVASRRIGTNSDGRCCFDVGRRAKRGKWALLGLTGPFREGKAARTPRPNGPHRDFSLPRRHHFYLYVGS
jgi:hypothetical protein